ncbi:RNA processing protein [Malassezia pachydermatis]
MLVELKNSETFNGHLVACDNYMNITLRDVYQTSPSGEQFWKMPEVYIKGSTIKYCRVADDLIDAVRESEEQARKQRQQAANNQRGHGRGGRGQRHGHHHRGEHAHGHRVRA